MQSQDPNFRLEVYRALKEGLYLKDRFIGLQRVKRCFSAEKAVDCMLAYGLCTTTHDAVALGEDLLKAGLIRSVSGGRSFRHKKKLYYILVESISTNVVEGQPDSAKIQDDLGNCLAAGGEVDEQSARLFRCSERGSGEQHPGYGSSSDTSALGKAPCFAGGLSDRSTGSDFPVSCLEPTRQVVTLAALVNEALNDIPQSTATWQLLSSAVVISGLSQLGILLIFCHALQGPCLLSRRSSTGQPDLVALALLGAGGVLLQFVLVMSALIFFLMGVYWRERRARGDLMGGQRSWSSRQQQVSSCFPEAPASSPGELIHLISGRNRQGSSSSSSLLASLSDEEGSNSMKETKEREDRSLATVQAVQGDQGRDGLGTERFPPPTPALSWVPSLSELREWQDYPLMLCSANYNLSQQVNGLPGPQRVPLNNLHCPVHLETDLFEGKLVLCVRGLRTTPEEMFSGKSRLLWAAVQGRFKERVCLADILGGQMFDRPWKLVPPGWITIPTLQAVTRSVSPAVTVSPLSNPGLLVPVIAGTHLMNISRRGEEPNIMEAREDVTLLGKEWLRDKEGSPLSAAERRRLFCNPALLEACHLEPDQVMTYHFHMPFLDLKDYSLQIGAIHYPMARHLDGQPIQVSMKHRGTGQHFFSLALWHETLLK